MLPRWSTRDPRTAPNRNTGRFITGPTTTGPLFASSSVSLRDRLRTRARLTNLAVGLILLALALSVIGNIHYYLYPTPGNGWHDQLRALAAGGMDRGTPAATTGETPASIETTIERTDALRTLDHLVIVAGHAIWNG